MKWPALLMLARHGQSSGNVALELAEANAASVIDIAARDVDVDLSELGEQQALALGDWLASFPETSQPTVILASPYRRAEQTAMLAASKLSGKFEIVFDERLREREFGIVDRYTKKGIIEQFPEQAELRARLGKFYYRAPGGESWCDVVLRLRSVMDSLMLEYEGKRVLIVCHTVVILCFRYLLEKLTEKQILEIDRETRLANCSLTTYKYDSDFNNMKLQSFNSVAPLKAAGEKVTTTPDAKIAPR